MTDSGIRGEASPTTATTMNMVSLLIQRCKTDRLGCGSCVKLGCVPLSSTYPVSNEGGDGAQKS